MPQAIRPAEPCYYCTAAASTTSAAGQRQSWTRSPNGPGRIKARYRPEPGHPALKIGRQYRSGWDGSRVAGSTGTSAIRASPAPRAEPFERILAAKREEKPQPDVSLPLSSPVLDVAAADHLDAVELRRQTVSRMNSAACGSWSALPMGSGTAMSSKSSAIQLRGAFVSVSVWRRNCSTDAAEASTDRGRDRRAGNNHQFWPRAEDAELARHLLVARGRARMHPPTFDVVVGLPADRAVGRARGGLGGDCSGLSGLHQGELIADISASFLRSAP